MGFNSAFKGLNVSYRVVCEAEEWNRLYGGKGQLQIMRVTVVSGTGIV